MDYCTDDSDRSIEGMHLPSGEKGVLDMEGAVMDHNDMLRKVSRTFALSIEQLPAVLRDIITLAYLLFRVSDFLEDNSELKADQKADLLRLWAAIVRGKEPPVLLTSQLSGLSMGLDDPEVMVAQNADLLIQQLQDIPLEPQFILIDHVAETSLGMAAWQDHGPYVADEAEMDDYMHHVAGRVGYLLTDVFAWYSPSIRKVKDLLMPLGHEFGLGLQTVNIIRGLRKDYERGWVFVPESFFKAVDLTRDLLFDPQHFDQACNVVEMLAVKAERHLDKALAYTHLLPRMQYKIRLFCIWPLLFAVRTLAISRNNHDVLETEAKIGRGHVRRIVMFSSLISWSNSLLTGYYHLLFRSGQGLISPKRAWNIG